MGDASGVIGYDGRIPELSCTPLHMIQDSTSVENCSPRPKLTCPLRMAISPISRCSRASSAPIIRSSPRYDWYSTSAFLNAVSAHSRALPCPPSCANTSLILAALSMYLRYR